MLIDDEVEAAEAYNAKARELRGEKAKLNVFGPDEKARLLEGQYQREVAVYKRELEVYKRELAAYQAYKAAEAAKAEAKAAEAAKAAKAKLEAKAKRKKKGRSTTASTAIRRVVRAMPAIAVGQPLVVIKLEPR